MLVARARMLSSIRRYFDARQVLEVETPLLAVAGGTDPAIEPLKTRFTGPGYANGLDLYMQTSPEFAMKALLANGSGSIYQICKAFRDGESGSRHNPEFTLLEWYELDIDHHQLMANLADLVEVIFERRLAVEKISYRQLFMDKLALDPLLASVSDLAEVALQHGISIDSECTVDEWLDILMVQTLEPELGQNGLSFVYDYPASQASLARLSATDQRLASRFELYYQGVELANGFHELANADEQRQRFIADNEQRQASGLSVLPIDERFLASLDKGLPECSGVAVGLDRLLMLKTGKGKLADVMDILL